MGGRKDDVTRTPTKQHKKRPLSAVIEEFEVEDGENKSILTATDSNNSNNNAINSGCDGQAGAKSGSDESRSVCSDLSQQRTGERSDSQGYNSQTPPSSPSSFSSSLSSPTSITPTQEKGGGSLPASLEPSSPQVPRKARSGRRQALIPASLSPKIGRRGSNSAFPSRLTSWGDVIDSDDEAQDMTRVRQTADRLHLSARRGSIMQWRARFVECPEDFRAQWDAGKDDVTGQNGDSDGRWTKERTQRINTALDWIRNELLEMRTQDQQLARQLLTIRSDLQQLKLTRSCEEHQDLLDDVQCELEELQEFAEFLDLPPTPALTDSPLKHLGVTRMNFSARRFSTC